MYLWLWRKLPGPRPLKVLQLVVLLLVFAWVCFRWVFPQVNDLLRPAEDQIVEAVGAGRDRRQDLDHIVWA